jgi:hypothetical protein
VLERFDLDDGWGRPGVAHRPFPFPYKDKAKTYYFDETTGADYGSILLTDNPTALLKANGVEPIQENFWKDTPETFDVMLILGVPSELTTVEPSANGLNIGTSLVLSAIEPVDPPDGTPGLGRLFFKLKIGMPLRSADGMSGAPIFGLKRMPDGTTRGWLLGIQSGELKEQGILIAVPIEPLADFYADLFSRIDQLQAEAQ